MGEKSSNAATRPTRSRDITQVQRNRMPDTIQPSLDITRENRYPAPCQARATNTRAIMLKHIANAHHDPSSSRPLAEKIPSIVATKTPAQKPSATRMRQWESFGRPPFKSSNSSLVISILAIYRNVRFKSAAIHARENSHPQHSMQKTPGIHTRVPHPACKTESIFNQSFS